ncbi:UNVERIFIED_CONTAM: MBL fold metallo-hydrolase [Halobacillus marinus]
MSVKTMPIADIVKKVLNKEELFLLDVRTEDAFHDWKIESDSFTYMNVPYFDLLDSVESITDQLPNDKEIAVVCAKGGSSEMVAELISEAGYENVYSVEGGMKEWSEHLEPVKVGDLSDGGSVYQFIRIGKGCLSYMVVSKGEAVVIDATRMTDVYKDFAEENNWKITHILDTHLHADHISGGRQLAEETGASYWLPPKDAAEVTFEYNALQDQTKIQAGNAKIDVHALYSPGHTKGSTSFVVDDRYLMTGDILFIDSIGRPDLAGKAEDWVADLRETLYTRYKELSAELLVLPAHFMTMEEWNEDHTIARKLGALFQENHGLNIEDVSEFRKLVTENLPPQPNAYQQIRETNMGKIRPDKEEQREMEVGPNRCAVR